MDGARDGADRKLGRPDDVPHSRTRAAALTPTGDQELLVAIGSRDWALNHSKYRPALLRAQPRRDRLDDFLVKLGLAHDTALSHPSLANLELRLDQGHQMRARRGQRQGGRERGAQ